MTTIYGKIRQRPSTRLYYHPSDPYPAELPWLQPDLDYRVPSGGKVGSGTLWDCTTAAQLTTAIAGAAPGDTIKVYSGTRYLISGVDLPNRDPANPIHVYCSKLLDGTWTPTPSVFHLNGTQTRGTRVEPALAYAVLGASSPLAQFVRPASAGTILPIIATLQGTGGGWRFEGIEFMLEETTAATGVQDGQGLILLGYDHNVTTPGIGDPITIIPKGYHFGFCIIHGRYAVNCRRGISVGASYVGFRDCSVYEIQQHGSEAQAISGWGNPGPFAAVNCFLSGSAETTLFGGSYTPILNVFLRNLIFKWNHYWKDVRWFTQAGIATDYGCKNHFEHKNGSHVFMEDCVMDHNSADGQDGTNILLIGTVNGNPNWPYMRLSDYTVKNVLVTGGGPLFTISGYQFDTLPPGGADPTIVWEEIQVSRLVLANILAKDICGTLIESWVNGTVPPAQWGSFISGAVSDLVVEHCTWEGKNQGFEIGSSSYYDSPFAAKRLILRNNVVGMEGGNGMFHGTGGLTEKALLDAKADVYNVDRNVFYTTNQPFFTALPTNNAAVTRAAVGFDTSYAANRPSGLDATSTYKGYATDGSDPGADVAGLNTMAAAIRTASYPPGASA